MATARYVPVKQGGKHFIDDNNMEYRRIKTKPNKVYYQCIKKNTLFCPAGAVISAETDEVLKLVGEHNHDSELLKTKVRTLENEAIRQSSTNSTVNPRTMLGALTNNISSEMERGIGSMRKSKAIVKAIQRSRNKNG